nr:MAG TPA: hypothetical protein [Caudoviricetes sp.]
MINLLLIDAIVLMTMASLATLFCISDKNPRYKKIKNKEGKSIRVNMNLIDLLVPALIWLVLALPYIVWRAGM